MYITQTLYANIVPSLFVVLSRCPQTDAAQFYNTVWPLYAHTSLGSNGPFVFKSVFNKHVSSWHHTWLRTRVLTSYMVAERNSSKLQVHRNHKSTKEIQSVLRDETLEAPWNAHKSETALADAVNHTVNISMESASLRCTYLQSRAQNKWNSKFVMVRNRSCQCRFWWQTATVWSS